MTKEAQKTQVEKIGEALMAIKPDVTSDDKKDLTEQLDVSEQTIVRYLKGDVRSFEKGLKMLEFFKGLIAAREAKINEVITS